ncbi:hypothetical protein MBLNU459_g0266t1 [Dothideomycetes sp. NU459]
MAQAAAHSLPPPFSSGAYVPNPNTTYDHKPATSTALAQNGQGMPMNSVPPASQIQPPQVYSGVRGNWRYSLHVDQQPIRARMCGFGDKDRRPITPPPCIKLVITDITTNKEVPAELIDPTFFVLQVDLWDESGRQEKNVVRAASNSPATSISTATTTSYPPPPERSYATMTQPMTLYPDPYRPGLMVQAPVAPYQPMYSQPQGLPSPYAGSPPAGYYAQPMAPTGYPAYPGAPPPGPPAMGYAQQFPQTVMTSPPQTGMFTRNLIGSLSVNAFTLRDPEGHEGHWFILQDLSVRTEGNFRLKMNFIDVGFMSEGKPQLNQGKAPVLASAFSQPFQVFSAKKFPGVIESTALSKTFAGQGIKIPIRKDGSKSEQKDEDDD